MRSSHLSGPDRGPGSNPGRRTDHTFFFFFCVGDGSLFGISFFFRSDNSAIDWTGLCWDVNIGFCLLPPERQRLFNNIYEVRNRRLKRHRLFDSAPTSRVFNVCFKVLQ